MDPVDDKKEPENKSLLKEYEISNTKANNIETLVWNTFSMIGILSISLLISDYILNGTIGWRVLILLGTLSISLTSLWWGIARRWWDIQATLFLRMKHIEEKLHLASNWYISIKDGVLIENINDSSKPTISCTEKDLEIHYDYDFAKRGIQKYLCFILLIIPFSWIARILIALPSYINWSNLHKLLLFRNIVTMIIVIYFIMISIFSMKEFYDSYSKTRRTIRLALLKSIKSSSSEKKTHRKLSCKDRRIIAEIISNQKIADKIRLTNSILDEEYRVLRR